MKKLFVLSASMMFCVTFLFAQEETEKSFQKDIGFNTTFIFQGIFQSGQTPFSLMFKKYTSENRAIRLGIDFSFNLDDNDTYPGSTTYQNNSSASFALAIGKEFQKPIDKRWTWYFGGDLVPFYAFNNQDVFQASNEYSQSESSSLGIGVRPFLGIRFNINPRLYLSVEANASLQYAFTKNYINYTDNVQPYVDTDGNNISLNMNPASGLFMYYRF